MERDDRPPAGSRRSRHFPVSKGVGLDTDQTIKPVACSLQVGDSLLHRTRALNQTPILQVTILTIQT